MINEFDASVPMDNPRWEKFAQNIAKGISTGKAYSAAGYKATGNVAETSGARLFRNAQVKARVTFLLTSDVKKNMDVRDLSREYTAEAILLQARAMRDESLSMSVRLLAAEKLIERGHGKAPQTIEVEITAYDRLSIESKTALIAAIDLIEAEDLVADGAGGFEVEPTSRSH